MDKYMILEVQGEGMFKQVGLEKPLRGPAYGQPRVASEDLHGEFVTIELKDHFNSAPETVPMTVTKTVSIEEPKAEEPKTEAVEAE